MEEEQKRDRESGWCVNTEALTHTHTQQADATHVFDLQHAETASAADARPFLGNGSDNAVV